MNTKIKLNICNPADPTSPRTWSGTPYNIYTELKKMDCLGSAFISSAADNKYNRKLLDLVNQVYYANSPDRRRGFLNRYLNSREAEIKTRKSGVSHTLHTGTMDLPFFKLPADQKHYLFCDSTWNLWSNHSLEMKGYSKRLINDAEQLEKKAYLQMEHIFPISEYVKNNLIGHYGISPDKITVVGTGLGVIKSYRGSKDYTNGKILFAAKDRFEDKGGFLVIEAFKRALEANPSLQLIIVGQNEYTSRIDLPNVQTYGFIPIEELQGLFDECSLFLMPAFNEPWGLVYLEALACRMPIVGLNRNSFPELSGYGKYGFGLDQPDPAELARIILDAFSNPGKIEKMGNKGQQFCIEKFSWSKTVNRIVTTIENLESKNNGM